MYAGVQPPATSFEFYDVVFEWVVWCLGIGVLIFHFSIVGIGNYFVIGALKIMGTD